MIDNLRAVKIEKRGKRDLTLKVVPFLDNVEKLVDWLLRLHVSLILASLLGISISKSFVSFIIVSLSPISDIVFYIYPQYTVDQHFHGNLGAAFYRAVVGETFFVAGCTGLLYAVLYFGRYWDRPWRFSEFWIEQVGAKNNLSSSFNMILIICPIFLIISAVVVVWFGIDVSFFNTKPDSNIGLTNIKLHAFSLWSILTSVTVLFSIFLLLLLISSLLNFSRNIMRLFIRKN